MIIQVDTLKNILIGTAKCLGKPEEDLLKDIQKIDFFSDDSTGYNYVAQNKQHALEEVYLCHVARKLNTDNYMSLLPLNELLTTQNSFSTFLKDHHISFENSPQGIDTLIYKGKYVSGQTVKTLNLILQDSKTVSIKIFA